MQCEVAINSHCVKQQTGAIKCNNEELHFQYQSPKDIEGGARRGVIHLFKFSVEDRQLTDKLTQYD
jgi:hypothetical protein